MWGWRTRVERANEDPATDSVPARPSRSGDGAGGGPGEGAGDPPARAAKPRREGGQRFLLDAPGWFHHGEDLPHLATVADAVWRERRLRLRYRRGVEEVSRTVDPLGLVLKSGTWYLVARHRGDIRTYRISRITDAVAGKPFARPDGFDRPRHWAQASADFDRSILRSTVRLRVSGHGARLLPVVLDAAEVNVALAASGPADAYGWREVEVAVESDEVAAWQLLGLGDGVEVLGPPAVREALAATAGRMAGLNRRRDDAPPRGRG